MYIYVKEATEMMAKHLKNKISVLNKFIYIYIYIYIYHFTSKCHVIVRLPILGVEIARARKRF